ncbi:MAG: family 78 glycoside hydrolase catalytic domain, partial [Bacteroidetes bacterium]|nr:family 78 glycoside hydrolase catalytic domain [Bacteroidota bacterium]
EGGERGVLQAGYQVLVSSSPEKLAKGEGDLWNSGVVKSDRSVYVPYAGKALTSRMDCWWKVNVFTNTGKSVWSAPAHWSMGLLNTSDWSAKWIGWEKSFPWDSITTFSRLSARYFRKEFHTIDRIKKARLYVSGLGLYEVYVNGQKIGDQVLAPSPTDYRRSVKYNVYDLTGTLGHSGYIDKTHSVAIGVVLGNGRFFTMRQNYKPQKINTFGYPKLLLQLEVEYASGKRQTIVSDDSWTMTADGPIRTNNEYDGEEYDATKEIMGWSLPFFKGEGWFHPELVAAPAGILSAQLNENMKVMDTIRPVSVKPLRPGVFIADMGQNMAGWLQLNASGQRGQKITLRFAESLNPDGSLYTANLRDAKVTDAWTLAGKGKETWHPRFVYHGFRYVEVSNYPGTPTINDFQGQIIYDKMATTGRFQTSDSTINRIYKNAWWGIAANYKGMPIDCPQRNERMPWLGDRVVGSRGESFLFDNANLYAKWLDDIEQSQTAEGAIPDVAPAFWNYYSDDMTWPAAYIVIADMLYHQFGDEQPIVKHYASMKKWLDYMRQRYMKDYIVTKDKYGDWCVPPESKELIHAKDSSRITDGVLIATAYYYRMLDYMQGFARLLQKPEDEKEYAELAGHIREAFNKKFYHPKTSSYSNSTVTSNLLPLYFGIAPDSAREAVFGRIVEKMRLGDHYHISTGLIGTQWLMRGLTDYQRPDIALTLATNNDYPSWGYMAANGATTIWELWNGNTANPQMNSGNHLMLLGDLLTWLYEDVAGIKNNEQGTAFKHILMQPAVTDGLSEVKASYRSPYGLIVSEWKKEISRFSWHIRIPANTTATIRIPASGEKYITESGRALDGDVRFVRMDGKDAILEIGSGDYNFLSELQWKKGIVKDEFIFTQASFPESHASTIAETPAGLIAAWFGGTKEGYNDVCIWTSHLVNGHWTAPAMAADGIQNDTLRYACYNPVLYQVPGGDLLLFYKIGPRVAAWKGYMKRSKDNGITWSAAEPLPAGYLGPVKNKPVLLSNGDLLCPSSTETSGWQLHFEVTRDQGHTWQYIGPINDGKTMNAIQPSVLFYPDGKLQVLCRSRNRAVLTSWSADNGKTWSAVEKTSLPNNNSGTDAVTLKDGRQLLVYNHVLPPGDLAKGPRTPLNVALSKDGKTWYASLVLEDSPISQYSYPSVIQSADGKIHIVYTWRRERIKYVCIDPAQLEMKEIINGQWPAPVPEFSNVSNEQ